MRPVHRGRKWFHRRFRADGDQAQVPVHISMIPLRNIVLRIIPELLIAAAGMPQLDNHRIPLLPAGSNRQEIVADNDHGSSGIQLHESRRIFHDLRLRRPAKIQVHLYDMVSRLNTALFQSPVQQLHRLRPAVMVGIREDNQIPLHPAAAVKVIHRRQIYILRKHLGLLLQLKFCSHKCLPSSPSLQGHAASSASSSSAGSIPALPLFLLLSGAL